MPSYNISDREGAVTISVFFDDGESRIVPKTSASFAPLLAHLLEHGSEDEDALRRLVDPAVFIGSEMVDVAGDRVTYDLRNLYFDGKALNSVLAQHIKDMIEQGDQNWKGLVRFMINLDANPSRNAQAATYAWVQAHGLTITEDGCFLGYKAVMHDHLSSSSGPDNYVDGVLLNEGVSCQVPHEVGSVISKKRADVDDTPGGGCSVGLHVGTYTYARKFAPVLMTVKVNPEHVVSADQSSHNFKIRVCQYEVVALNKDKVDFIGTTTSSDLGSTGEAFDVNDTTEGEGSFYAEEDAIVADNDAEQEAAQEAFEQGEDETLETYREIPTLDEEDVADIEVPKPETIAVSFDGSPVSTRLKVPEGDNPTLADWAGLNSDLWSDLMDTHLGHKPLAAKWSDITSEASVRRFRKSHGVSLTLLTKIKG